MQVMIANELAPLWLLVMSVVTAVGLVAGVQSEPIGRLGLGFAAVTLFLILIMIGRSVRSLGEMRSAVASFATVDTPALRWGSVVVPYPYRLRPGIDRIDAIEYAPSLFLDLYRSTRERGTPAPMLMHIHGGSWGGGDRRQQAQPLIQEMAVRGWIVVSVDYPFVPEATFPDQVVALHGGLRWLRDNADVYGIDPGSLFVTGGSAGAHLASLVALTDRASEWTLRRADEAPVAGVVVMYGVYDLLDRNGIRDFWPIVTKSLIKADPDLEPEKFHRGSPIDHVHRDAPPFLVVHGANDSLVPVHESEHFVSALEAVSLRPVAFAELKGATHAFDAVDSLRTQYVVAGIAAFLEEIRRTRSSPDSAEAADSAESTDPFDTMHG
jgi:acetyl esterase/lipase